MRIGIGMLLALGLVATPALAQKITLDYAHAFDFSKVKTFEYVETKESNSPDQLTDGRIKDAIVKQLEQGGLTQVDSSPDIFVTYHVTTKEDTVYETTGFGYGGFGAGWRGWGMGMGSATTTSTTYTDGTLIIDAYGPQDKKMIWRGTGTVTVKSKPEKQAQQIENIVADLGAKWAKVHAGKGE